MTHKTFLKTTSVIFGIIAVLHLVRTIAGWDAMIGTLEVPVWASIIAVIVAGYLSYQSCMLAKK